MAESPNRAAGGLGKLVVRAAFVPEGQRPPQDFMAGFDALHMRATLDPATGLITCDNAGTNFNGDVVAEWHPDDQGDAEGGDGMADEDGDGMADEDGSARESGEEDTETLDGLDFESDI